MLNTLVYNGDSYDSEIIAGVGGLSMSHAMAGETLAVDTLSLSVMSAERSAQFIASDQTSDDWFFTADGYEFCSLDADPIPEYVAGGSALLYYGADVLGKYYLDELHRTGVYERQLSMKSAISILDRSKHEGGIYTGQDADTVIGQIIGNTVTYTVDDDIAEILVYGYLPYATRRNNLQMLLMAVGATVKNASDGSLRITTFSEVVVGAFDESRVFIGATVKDLMPVTAVQVTEHNYIANADEVTLFDDSTVLTETVVFSEPYHTLTITGGTIVASGVNYCTFTGAGAVVLKGKKYTHVTRVVTEGITPTGASTDYVKSVTNNTLLAPNNATQVAGVLYDFLTVGQAIAAEVVFGAERTADIVTILHPYTLEEVSACVKSMDIQFGATELRAKGEFLVGYIPSSFVAGYTNYVVLTGSGSWTVPAGVVRVRAIVVGGGDGGGDGGDGLPTPYYAVNEAQAIGGAGGAAGVKGTGALIVEFNLSVTAGSGVAYVCASVAAVGAVGGATTFGAYSSALGKRYPSGYSEPKSGLTLANDGAVGVAGGVGNAWKQTPSGDVVFGGVIYSAGVTGADDTYGALTALGGGGGGAAVGAGGANGEDGLVDYTWKWIAFHGDAGAGATASVAGANAANYGAGGSGGHGGGGAGYVIGNLPDREDQQGAKAAGGSGSSGGTGGAGCVIVYY